MKYFYSLLLGGCMGCLLLASCFDEKDFDFDQLKYDNLNPVFHLPFFTDTLRLTDAMKGDHFRFDDNGQAYFVFDLGDFTMPDMPRFFEMKSVTHMAELTTPNPINVSIGGPFQYPNGMDATPPDATLSDDRNWLVSQAVLEFNDTNIAPDSIVSNVTITVTNEAPLNGSEGWLYVEFPDIRDMQGNPVSERISIAPSTPVRRSEKYSVKVSHPTPLENVVNVKYRIDATSLQHSGGPLTIKFKVDINEINVEKAYGYFGKQTQQASQEIPINDFSDFDGSWLLKEASVALDIENEIAIPMRLAVNYTDNTTGGAETPIGLIDINAPTAANLGTPVTTQATIGGAVMGPLISTMPSSIRVGLDIETNPDYTSGPLPQNALSTTAKVAARARLQIPLKIGHANISLSDTSAFSTSDISFHNMGLLLNVKNSFPVGVKMQCILLEKQTGNNLGPLFEEDIEIPAGHISPLADGESEVSAPFELKKLFPVVAGMEAKLKTSDKIIVTFTASFGNAASPSTFVRLTDKNNIQIQIGVRAGINVEDIIDR
jgi:hypothetical protein